MKTAQIIYKGNLRTEAIHLQSGTRIITDAPTDNEGRGEAFSPTDLVATALGSCMLTIIGIKARDSGFNLDNITVDITKIMASDPRRIDEIVVAFHFEGRTYSEKEKTIIERAARTCPVALSISTEIKQRISFNW